MEGLKPCPYCGGEVELVKLNKKPGKPHFNYRIQCHRCKQTAIGNGGFPKETNMDAMERVQQYNDIMAHVLSSPHSTIFRQSVEAKNRDRLARYSSRYEREIDVND